MSVETRFGVIAGTRRAEVHSHELPELKPGEVLIRGRACNICTFDYQQWLGLRSHQPFPQAFGHEDSGEIAAVGPEVSGFEVGDHVVLNIYRPCLTCHTCREDLNMKLCQGPAPLFLSQNEHGYYGLYGCATYKIVPALHVFKIVDDLPFEEAGFCEPLATVIHGIRRLRLAAREKVLVIGAGTMGLLNAQVARYYGADVIISEPVEAKRAIARQLGFEHIIDPATEDFKAKVAEYTDGTGPDAVIIAVGATKAYEQAFEVGPELCRFLIFAASFPAPQWNIDPNLVHYKMWEIIGCVGSNMRDYQESVDLLNKRAINLNALIEARFSLDEIQKAFERAATPGSYRVSVML